ncbi:MAG: DUF167 domain-containing protein, partial [Candidatus Hermodarchaeota archaeon]
LNNKEFILNIKAKPNSKKQAILKFTESDNSILVMLKSKAIKNKANKELIQILQKKLKLNSNQIEIISGVKSQTKRIKLSFSRVITKTELVSALN